MNDAPPAQIRVCDVCTVSRLDVALRGARPGTRIVLDGGTARGHFVVRVPLEIEGRGNPTIDAGGSGTALRIEAPRVRVSGVTFRGSIHRSETGDEAAVVVTAAAARIEDNRFVGNSFGISLVRAPGSLIARNVLVATGPLQDTYAGDAIRVWASRDVVIEDNLIRGTRDVIVFFSDGATLRRNRVSGARYGLHDMYSNAVTVEDNVVQDCEIGSNFMYARNVRVIGNVFAHNRGATGYGAAIENVDDVTFEGNAFIDDHVGLQIVQSPSRPEAANVVRANSFVDNGTAIAAQSVTTHTSVVGNNFAGNLEQVRVDGGASLDGMRWDDGRRGNRWSDYAGYDRDGNGLGNMPYAPRGAYEALTDAHPEDEIFRFGAAAQALDFAARAVPIVAPPPKLIDRHPLMTSPTTSAGISVPLVARGTLAGLALFAGALAAAPVVAFGFAVTPGLRRPARRVRAVQPGATPARMLVGADGPAIVVRGLTKRYGRREALRDVTFTVRRGEALALWGPNGAGKTTIIRALLGQIWYDGEVSVFDERPTPTSAAARRRTGYAPQRFPDIESSARELALLVARLRGLSEQAAVDALSRAGMSTNSDTAVGALSGGMRQRLAVALALLGDSALLVLDEPSAGLDRASRRALLDSMLEEKARGRTIVFASHLLEDVARVADRVLVLDEGRVVSVDDVGRFTAAEAAS